MFRRKPGLYPAFEIEEFIHGFAHNKSLIPDQDMENPTFDKLSLPAYPRRSG